LQEILISWQVTVLNHIGLIALKKKIFAFTGLLYETGTLNESTSLFYGVGGK
jgi:hypothetical protein